MIIHGSGKAPPIPPPAHRAADDPDLCIACDDPRDETVRPGYSGLCLSCWQAFDRYDRAGAGERLRQWITARP